MKGAIKNLNGFKHGGIRAAASVEINISAEWQERLLSISQFFPYNLYACRFYKDTG
jgi:hypothetical protein